MTGPLDPTGIDATAWAKSVVADLVREGGPVMFYQSGGCCEGSVPMCFRQGEFIIGDHDVLIGTVSNCPFYIDHRQYEVWKGVQLTLDVESGEPEGFSLPAGRGRHFVVRSRLREVTSRDVVKDR
jgi:hypothetical protein